MTRGPISNVNFMKQCHVRISSPLEPTPHQKINTPIWHSRNLLNQLAGPTGVSSLDERSVRTRARTKTKPYTPLKPDKYAIRFYAIVGWDSLYIHSLWDNGPMLIAEISLEKDTSGHSQCYGSFCLGHHEHDIKQKYCGHRLAKNNLLCLTTFYTDMYLLKRYSLLLMKNRVGVSKSKECVGQMEDGGLEVTAAVGLRRQVKRDTKRSPRKVAKDNRIPFPEVAPVTITPHPRYVVFKDSKTVLRRAQQTLFSNSEEAIICVHGLLPIATWIDDEMTRRTILHVGAYNEFMNAIDRVDHCEAQTPRSANTLPVHPNHVNQPQRT
ncbi:Hypothetical protein PHPALM_11339 [Phytophthora palmivora]|uniref:Uncharacterized protein n=1 Tax=Phytophthora palmivora TaxID=4796 RepID=A0A2P4Y2J4_9STRA|nr:Hypothetical protein PHPALM_11339 [Phytophthora palmivora]